MNDCPLTEQQLDVLALAADGMTDEQIGQRVGLSYDQVRWRLKAAYALTPARDRTHAVAIAIRKGWIP